MSTKEPKIEKDFIAKLQTLKYTYRPDIRDNQTLEQNFREKFQALNRVTLTDHEFARLLEQIISPHVFTSSKRLREINSFERDDGTPLHYTLINIKDWCKNSFEVISQLKINTHNSNHRYDVILLLNGLPLVQDEFSDAFLSKCKLAQTINRYMVLVQSEAKLRMMRPYQIYAVEAIIECIDDNRGNGYIWHTTGSGKTLTSFKASTLLNH
ncbi:MAG: hypothetical protein GQ582_03385 [Methyloprofundus sp.]|nr:hypothetical protein [Methyloprofundus sp.]